MAVQLTILPVNVEPKPDELFSSWLFRLADGNFSKAHTFCRFHLPGYNIWNRDIDKLAPDSLLRRLSHLTEVDFDRLYQTTLRSFEGKLFTKCNAHGNQKWVLALGIFHRTRKSTGLQFCPKCLIDDGEEPYFRKSWRLAVNVSCPRCHILLHDACPHCESPITFFRNEIGYKHSSLKYPLYICYKCKGDLREAFRYPPKIGIVSFQKRLASYIESKDAGGRNSVEYFNTLYQLLKFLRSRTKFFKRFQASVFSYEGLTQQGNIEFRDFEKSTVLYRERLLKCAVWILDNWPARFVELCKESKLSTNYLIKDFKDMPAWFKEIAESNLRQPDAPMLSLIRKQAKTSSWKKVK